MRGSLARALVVLTVFVLLGVLAATDRYVTRMAAPAVPRAPAAGAEPGATSGAASAPARPAQSAVPAVLADRALPIRVFFNEFRLYVSWALLTPGIWYLSRRFPLLGRHRAVAVTVHALVPVALSVPFFYYRLLVGVAFGLAPPSPALLLQIPFGRVFLLQTAAAAPVYWLLAGLGTLVQFSRDEAASKLGEIELRRSLAVAQHDTLKMKLQPHFLFNALNAMSSLARAGDTDAVVRVVDRLGTALRLSMETSARQFVPLQEELALVEAYLAVEQVRYGDRLRVVRRIEPETRRALVPNLILQPLVENALVHGLARRIDASLLELAARREDGTLRLVVRDDGPGLPGGWTLAARAGDGLRNVCERIGALFPGAGSLRMDNGPTGGTVAVLSIPFADAETTAVSREVQR